MKNKDYAKQLLEYRRNSRRVHDQESYLREVFYTVVGASVGFVVFASIIEYLA